jgi:hypothetical protein
MIHGTRPSTWSDIRTWVGFAVVIIGATIALIQMDLQRRQLASQQDVLKGEVERNKRRDALLDGQLRELEQRARTLDRQQAEEVDLRPGSTIWVIPGFEQPSGAVDEVYSADVANGSRRPIRNVACRIEAAPGDGLQEARLAGLYVEFAGPQPRRRLVDPAETPRIQLIGAGKTASFIFAVDPPRHPEARMTARFTDDAGLHWQINHDLHLEPLPDRSGW